MRCFLFRPLVAARAERIDGGIDVRPGAILIREPCLRREASAVSSLTMRCVGIVALSLRSRRAIVSSRAKQRLRNRWATRFMVGPLL